MNPPPGVDGVSLALDAVVFSPHKFVGGPSASGILVVKRALMQGPSPAHPGACSVAQASVHGVQTGPVARGNTAVLPRGRS